MPASQLLVNKRWQRAARAGPARPGRRARRSLHVPLAEKDGLSDGLDKLDAKEQSYRETLNRVITEAGERIKAIMDDNNRGAASPAQLLEKKNTTLSVKIYNALTRLTHGLVERDTEARLLLLAALAGEHVLFLGPPGTAKSELARRLHSCLEGSAYFERLLTRFSVPEEIFGPLSMRALEQDQYLRKTKGYLPEAEVAFVDEVFKANSAILNTLLTLLNERLFDNGTERAAVPLVCLVAASNELPESEELDALYDRFLLRRDVSQVSPGALGTMLRDVAAPTPVPEAVEAPLTIADISAVRDEARRTVRVPDDVIERLVDLRTYMQEKMEPPAYVSDRRLAKSVALMQVSAFTCGRKDVNMFDLLLMRHVAWTNPEDAELIFNWLLRAVASEFDMQQSNYLLSSYFGQTCHALDDSEKQQRILEEVRKLKAVLSERLHLGISGMKGVAEGSIAEHVWISAEECDMIATAVLPKIQQGKDSIKQTLLEVVTLEVAIEQGAEAVVLAQLMPTHWSSFIRNTSGDEARELGTVPIKQI